MFARIGRGEGLLLKCYGSARTQYNLRSSAATLQLRPRRTLSSNAEPAASASAGPPAVRGFWSQLGILFFAGMSLTGVGLGYWQTQRYYWKTNLIEEKKKNLLVAPHRLPEGLTQSDFAEAVAKAHGERVLVIGEWEHDKEVLLGRRSAPPGLVTAVARGMATNPQGYFVVTPLRRPDGTTVFVNRGWVPLHEKAWERPKGLVTFEAVACGAEQRAQFVPENVPASKTLFWLEAEALIKATGLHAASPAVILESVEPDEVPVKSYPAARRHKHLIEQSIAPETHVVYAIIWFSLAIAGSVVAYYNFKKGGGRRLGIRRREKA